MVEFPPLDPAAEAKMDPDFMMKVVGDHAPARGLPVKHPLMHRTRTVDYAVILSGEIDMMLDDTVVHVKPCGSRISGKGPPSFTICSAPNTFAPAGFAIGAVVSVETNSGVEEISSELSLALKSRFRETETL